MTTDPEPIRPDDADPGASSDVASAPPPAPPSTVGVRYGYMKHVGEFTCSPKIANVGCGEDVVIQTERGIELGRTLMLHCLQRHQALSTEQVDRYVAESGQDYYRRRCGRVLRVASEDDLAEYRHLEADARGKLALCAELVRRHDLPMKLVQCEHLFGGERVIFYFMAEGRVDFRALVKDLAHEYQTRIEMRQVGARDEARLVADYETCGRECCCRVFLKTLRQVTMKMAKLQKATLDPSKVSGRCGRLKCCLRYEHMGYEELDQALPRTGVRLDTPEGPGVVVARQVLTQLVQIAKDAGGIVTYPMEDIHAWAEEKQRREAEREAEREAAANSGAPQEMGREGGSRRRRSRPRRRPRSKARGQAEEADARGAAERPGGSEGRDATDGQARSDRADPQDPSPRRGPRAKSSRPGRGDESRASDGKDKPPGGEGSVAGGGAAPKKRRRRRSRRRGGRGKRSDGGESAGGEPGPSQSGE